MQVTVDIPDELYRDVEKTGKNMETSIIQALELYTERKKMLVNDPLYKWGNTPARDKDDKSDVSENPDKYIETIINTINNRPRKSLGWKTPAKIFSAVAIEC